MDATVTSAIQAKETNSLTPNDFDIESRRMLVKLNANGYMEESLQFLMKQEDWSSRQGLKKHIQVRGVLQKACKRFNIEIGEGEGNGMGKGGPSLLFDLGPNEKQPEKLSDVKQTQGLRPGGKLSSRRKTAS